MGGGSSAQAATYARPGTNPTSAPSLPSEGIQWNAPGPVGANGTPNPGNMLGYPGSYTYNLPQIRQGGQSYRQPSPPSPGLGTNPAFGGIGMGSGMGGGGG